MMRDQPTSIELLQAVIDFIRGSAIAELQGQAAFHARVAANVLDIVKRELQLGAAAEADELARLRRLLGKEGGLDELNAELCENIRHGNFTLQTPGLHDHLWALTMDKLAVDQPGYASYRRQLQEDGQAEAGPGREAST